MGGCSSLLFLWPWRGGKGKGRAVQPAAHYDQIAIHGLQYAPLFGIVHVQRCRYRAAKAKGAKPWIGQR